MPKHRFDGRWNYFEMPDGAPVPTPGRQMILAIPDESGRVDEDNSSHAGHRVDGEASNSTLDLTRTHTQTGIVRTLTGTKVFDEKCGEVDHIVIVGRFVDPDSTRDQNEGTWVITKP